MVLSNHNALEYVLDLTDIQSKANETENKISQIMKIYVGDQADSSEG
jgi:hypothetical protein